MYSRLKYDPLLKNLKTILPPKIYDKVIIQYNLGKRDYERKILSQEEGSTTFEVSFENRASEEDIIENEVDLACPSTKYIVEYSDKIVCSCNYYETTGLICRHIFFICFCENIEDMHRLVISKRWSLSFEQLEKHFSSLPENRILNKSEEKKNIQDESSSIMEISDKKEEKFEEKKREDQDDKAINEVDSENEESKSVSPRKESPIKNFRKVVVKKGAPTKAAKGKFII